MEFGFDLHELLNSDRVVSVWDAASLADRRGSAQWAAQMTTVIDTMGRLSAQAQGLHGPITTRARLAPGQRVYLHADQNRAMGILKVGPKRLFIRGATGDMREIEPLCVLDFYVHESVQRTGVGHTLFDVMLATEQVSPHRLGYDRPSPKLLAFLKRHYGLTGYVPQANKFVVFDAYFDETLRGSAQPLQPSGPSAGRRSLGGPAPAPWATDDRPAAAHPLPPAGVRSQRLF